MGQKLGGWVQSWVGGSCPKYPPPSYKRSLLHTTCLKITHRVLILATGRSRGHTKDRIVTLENRPSPSQPLCAQYARSAHALRTQCKNFPRDSSLPLLVTYLPSSRRKGVRLWAGSAPFQYESCECRAWALIGPFGGGHEGGPAQAEHASAGPRALVGAWARHRIRMDKDGGAVPREMALGAEAALRDHTAEGGRFPGERCHEGFCNPPPPFLLTSYYAKLRFAHYCRHKEPPFFWWRMSLVH